MKKQLLKISACAVLLALFSISFAAHVGPIKTMVIPVGTATIDDAGDETFYSAEQTTDAFNKTGCATYPDADFTFSFKVCYDANYLYIFGTSVDDTPDITPDEGATSPWTFDNSEIFIDLDTNNSGVVTGYDTNTVQLRVNRGMDSVQTFGRAPRTAYQLMWEDTSDGWIYEVAVPWKAVLSDGQVTEDIMMYVAEGMAHGFDMAGADSDGDPTAGSRDCQTAWDNDEPSDDADRTEDNAWNNRSVFGVVTFEPLIIAIDNVTTADATVYPNPTSGAITFENLNGATSIEIMNLAGQVVLTADVTNSNIVDMSQLTSGIYVAKVGQSFVKVVKN